MTASSPAWLSPGREEGHPSAVENTRERPDTPVPKDVRRLDRPASEELVPQQLGTRSAEELPRKHTAERAAQPDEVHEAFGEGLEKIGVASAVQSVVATARGEVRLQSGDPANLGFVARREPPAASQRSARRAPEPS